MTSPNPPASKADIAAPGVRGVSTTGAKMMKFVPVTTYLIEAFLLFANDRLKNSPWNGFMPNDDPSPLSQTPLTFYIGILCVATAASIRYSCYKAMGKQFTYEVTMFKDHHLVTTGPYSIVRHPSYIATPVHFLGICILWASKGSWVQESKLLNTLPGQVVVATWLLLYSRTIVTLFLRVGVEDELLRNKFGDEWIEWKRRVPFKLLPGVY
ncbi:hypothetical protein K435DRAFT_753210 [Dendrothele bispora CBS 962.96]|uniref:Protein-S-isoprenylcysteine O-methyltransferase n=1 Tax=Dendrothele bispora (strain CBS 962.96) TaxID=1314807 RepID=A0A4S8M7E9_DENBC|nr:hypothetical protein K435DRAFT_753210 [Dendrothele bispora CBS 962.96]